MENEIIAILSSIGLTETESKIYLKSIYLGTSSATKLATIIGIPRSTVRYSCEDLVKKGLMLAELKGNTKYFTPEKPEIIKNIFIEKENKINHQKHKFDNLLPQLIKMYNPFVKAPKIQEINGIEGYMKAFNSILDIEGEDYLRMFSGESTINFFTKKEYYINPKLKESYFNLNRQKHHIKNLLLTNSSEIGLVLKSKDKEENRETRFLKKDLCDIASILLRGNITILLFSFRPIKGLIIFDENITNIIKNMFDYIWEDTD